MRAGQSAKSRSTKSQSTKSRSTKSRSTDSTRTSRNLRAAAAVAGMGLLAGVLAACGGTASGATGGQSITLYSGQHVQTTDALVTEKPEKAPAMPAGGGMPEYD